MKNLLLSIIFLFTSLFLFSQSTTEDIINVGIRYYDDGLYEMAKDQYQKVLEIEPKNSLAHYELGMTYLATGDFEKAIYHSNKCMKYNKEHTMPALIVKSSALDYLGKTKKSIRLLKKAIRKYGGNHLLYYNLAYDYIGINKFQKAEEALLNAIAMNRGHASSHLLMAQLMTITHQRVKGLLCLHYFILLEPDTERTETALEMLNQLYQSNVEIDDENPLQINITINAAIEDSKFGQAEASLSLLSITDKLAENTEKSSEELFMEKITSLFKLLGELKEDSDTGLWWDFYIPLFDKLARSEHMKAYCCTLQYTYSDEALLWLNDHKDAIDKLGDFLVAEVEKL